MSTLKKPDLSDPKLRAKLANFALNLGSERSGFFKVDIWRTNNGLSIRVYKGPEIPCLRIIKKCINMKTANDHGNTKV